MTSQEFILSQKPSVRLFRHTIFWLLFSLHFVIQNLMIGGPGEGATSRTVGQSFLHLLYFMPIYLTTTYIYIELVLPGTIYRRNYLTFVMVTLFMIICTAFMCSLSGAWYIHNHWDIPYESVSFDRNKYHVVVDGIFLPAMIWGIAGGFKLSKKWYQQQKENEELEKMKIDAEIKLLKLQIHPRFIFYSLASLKSGLLAKSHDTPQMVLQLSDLLSYLLYESEQPYIPAEKELENIRSYFSLQYYGMGEARITRLDVKGSPAERYSPTLAVFSFVEHCFDFICGDPPGWFLGATFELDYQDSEVSATFQAEVSSVPEMEKLAKETCHMIGFRLNSLFPGLGAVMVTRKQSCVEVKWSIPLYNSTGEQVLNQADDAQNMAI